MRKARSNLMSALSAAARRPMSFGASRTCSPFTARIRLPVVIPARSAGPSRVTVATSSPSVSRGPPEAATLKPIKRGISDGPSAAGEACACTWRDAPSETSSSARDRKRR